MSTFVRNLVAVPVALTAVGLFAATSQVEWESVAISVADATIVTDAEGRADGQIEVIVRHDGPADPDSPAGLDGMDLDGLTLNLRLEGDDVRRSLDVYESDVADPEASAQQVRKVAGFYRDLPRSCEEFDEASSGPLSSCTVVVDVSFLGRRDKRDDVRIVADLGNWDYGSLDDALSLEVRYIDLGDDEPEPEE